MNNTEFSNALKKLHDEGKISSVSEEDARIMFEKMDNILRPLNKESDRKLAESERKAKERYLNC
jgi:hypothetical protein